MAELAEALGTYVLTSASATRVAFAPSNKRYPEFTGVLLDILERGVEGGPELLDVETIYRTLRERLVRQGSPQPQRNSQDEARLALGVNHAADTV
ncbi:hypothetical protein [Streptomyces sp. NPDC001880]